MTEDIIPSPSLVYHLNEVVDLFYKHSTAGYIFLYALVIRGIGIPAPSVQHFKYEIVVGRKSIDLS